jgi:hypothetical protein
MKSGFQESVRGLCRGFMWFRIITRGQLHYKVVTD